MARHLIKTDVTNRRAYLIERRKMLQLWADYLDKIKAGAEVINLHGHVA